MKKIFPNRGMVMIFAILLVAGGIAWTTYQQRMQEVAGGDQGGFPITGYVSSHRWDAIGCSSSLPFAAKECRLVAKIHFRVTGTTAEQTYIAMDKYYFLPAPSLTDGEEVTGVCAPTGRCTIDQLKGRPYGLIVSLLCVFGAMLVGGWIYRQNKRRKGG